MPVHGKTAATFHMCQRQGHGENSARKFAQNFRGFGRHDVISELVEMLCGVPFASASGTDFSALGRGRQVILGMESSNEVIGTANQCVGHACQAVGLKMRSLRLVPS